MMEVLVTFEAMRVFFNVIWQAVLICTLCRILSMRSNVVFAAVNMGLMGVMLILEYSELPRITNALMLAPLINIAFPIAYSRGSLRTRTVRVLVVQVTVAFSEVLVSALYALTANGAIDPVAAPDRVDIGIAAAAYIVALIVQAGLTELIVHIFRRREGARRGSPYPPVILYLLWSYLLVMFSQMQLAATYARDSFRIISLIYPLFTLGIGIATLAITFREECIGREATTRSASARQEKHMRREVAASARRVAAICRLRHDLANQIALINELERLGDDKRADATLAELQSRAHAIAEAHDEMPVTTETIDHE